MRTAAKGFAIGAGALAVAITACIDATRPTSLEPALYEGAPVSMTGSMQVSAIVNGKPFTSTVHEWAVDGVVRNGIAEASREPGKLVDNRAMPVFAISDDNPLARSRPNGRQFVTFKDNAGNLHDFVIRTGARGGPVSSLVHVENGKITQSFSYEWRKVRGGWKAEGLAVTAFKDGKPVLTVRSGTKLAPPGVSKMVLPPDDPCWFDPQCTPVSGGGGAGGGGGGGSPGGVLSGGGGTCSCTNEMMSFLGAGWMLGMSTGHLLVATTVTIFQWGGLGGGYVMLGWLAIRWISCVDACNAQNPSGGGGGSGWTIVRSSPAMLHSKSSP